MALSDLSFKIYTDSLLTSAFTGTIQLTHESNLSDNPQDFQYWVGSAETAGSRTLEAVSNPGVDQITLTPTDGLVDWAATTAYILGDTIEPTTPNTYRYECTTAGTSGASEPTFPTSGIGSTVVDGTAVWTLVANRHEITEIKLATTSGGLASATAGAALNLGTSILSGSANAVELHIRVTNAVTQVSNNTGNPEITLDINSVQET